MKYDNKIEEQLNSLICHIDTKPNIVTHPLEDSSYLDVKLLTSEDGFHVQVQALYDQFTDYIGQFIQQNSADPKLHIHIASTLSRLLAYYQQAQSSIKESPLRIEWKTLSEHHIIPNPTDNFNIKQKEKYYRQAYTFFYKMSSVQLWFLDLIIQYLDQQLAPYQGVKENAHVEETTLPKPDFKKPKKPQLNPIYYFTITEEHYEHYEIKLNKLHDNLSKEGFIDCTLPQFKKLFYTKDGSQPKKTPKPIIWLTGYYTHLCFFIQCLVKNKFIPNSKQPFSFNDIALNLFYDSKEGAYFKPKSKKCDVKIKTHKHDLIEKIVSKSILLNKQPTL